MNHHHSYNTFFFRFYQETVYYFIYYFMKYTFYHMQNDSQIFYEKRYVCITCSIQHIK
ncbi:hypothetical protein BDA99DRAFT_501138 [Phascolomyces articulosus]|uniref:Uncharacterized protein n=1 Tax=Phascolomyces articulosus TaxID=60185 RepID=A0AAD5K775_9FUNG|nr:hypothetical protein BDA99DRAFT_501138 [Phascolomyces articulosus]